MISLGRLLRHQGKRGELRFKLHDERLIRRPGLSRIFVGKRDRVEEYRVESIRPGRNNHLIKLDGVDSLSQAKELVGLDVLVPEEDLKPLEAGSYYEFDLVGCTVLNKNGEEVGRVKDLWPVPENTLLVVDRGGREILIPFTQSICFKVRIAQKEILIDPPPGLLDLNEI